ncbi:MULTISPECIES: multiple monosaccharide ABC transporter substrate-binding protein [Ensifer]|jgi:putative multiple sugar transport system substrate-binding protein|uniref:Substrate-binding domain-containing protein n=1 Tax=Ensifer canadensis TaxID=555315 RepID=A0AAW4FLZ3_9HYPH|nr:MULTISPECIES: multiple monosaccharide ABC transporter substrate-binding protein [Ensifer]AHK45147.1 multiple sugar-binding periplasmic receptor ChvE precursor [Ensifer adhaerens OV14]MDP9630131.1 putative multiple sugar transport system substrate-binding protein [Ensifer adhaerens]KQW46138.1 sugar ABC transporter substrate-binding protein [Ensifer sp. Root1252]KQW83417.1 sugar ABC transporter substrate-binding protein [Ensifer sp. Root127]KQY65949.1 sugar ABC transporter substrate-binding p
MKLITSLLAAAAISVASFAAPAFAQDKGTVGISMPTKTSTRWISDGETMEKLFKEAGYTPDLQFADDDIPNQLAQIENMVTKGAKVLVIGAIDGTTLSDILQKAHDAGVKVIAYDRLIRDSGNVDYYATFDNFQVGVQQATSLVQGLKLDGATEPKNVELFGGSPDDNNAFFFYDGAMSVLQPLIDSNKIVVKSGQKGMDQVGTLRWDGAVAQARMENLLSSNYTDAKVDGVLSPYDGLSIGIISALKGVGYGSGDMAMPAVTGQDAELPSVKSILAGEQYSSIFKDTRELAKVTVGMVNAIMEGKEPEVNDTKTYDNGVKVVPSYLLKPVAVDKSNIKDVLVSSGYYTEDQINN